MRRQPRRANRRRLGERHPFVCLAPGCLADSIPSAILLGIMFLDLGGLREGERRSMWHGLPAHVSRSNAGNPWRSVRFCRPRLPSVSPRAPRRRHGQDAHATSGRLSTPSENMMRRSICSRKYGRIARWMGSIRISHQTNPSRLEKGCSRSVPHGFPWHRNESLLRNRVSKVDRLPGIPASSWQTPCSPVAVDCS